MKSRLSRTLLLASIVLGSGAGLLAHERLRVGGDGNPLFWSTPSNVGIVINSDVTPRL